MIEVKLYKTTLKALKLLALTAPFVLFGIWDITKADASSTEITVGWLVNLFFGLGIPIGLFHLFDKRPQIIINENSIWDRTTNQNEVKWEQIKGAYPLNISGQKFISIKIDDSFVFIKKQYKWAAKINEAIGAQQFNLHLGQLKIDEKKLTSFIHEMMKSEKESRSAIIKKYFANAKYSTG